MNPEHETLFHRYLDAHATPEEAAALAELLVRDPAAADRFASLCRLDEALRVEFKAEARSAVFIRRLNDQAGTTMKEPAAKRTVFSANSRGRWAAAAAVLALLGATVWMNHWMSGVASRSAVSGSSGPHRSAGGGADSMGNLSSGVADRGSNPAAELRRKLRGFALPLLHVRSVPLSDALATLNHQWKDLPHVNPGAAETVGIAVAPEAISVWKSKAEEPQVTLDIPGLSLYTALDLIAAQAGLKVVVSDHKVRLEPDPKVAESAEKTWTLELAKSSVETFMAALPSKAPEVLLGRTLTSDVQIETRFVETSADGVTIQEAPKAAVDGVRLTEEFQILDPKTSDEPARSGAEAEILSGMLLADAADPQLPGQPAEMAQLADVDFDTNYLFMAPSSGKTDELAADLPLSTHFLADQGQVAVWQTTWASHAADRLPGWLAGYGVPEANLRYQAGDGVLSVTGGARARRIAAAAVAALRESVRDGVSLEMRVIPSAGKLPDDWKETGMQAVSGSRVEKLLRSAAKAVPAVPVVRLPPALSPPGEEVFWQFDKSRVGVTTTSRKSSQGPPIANFRDLELQEGLGMDLAVRVKATKSGERWDLSVSHNAPREAMEGPVTQFAIMDGQWLAVPLKDAGEILLIRPGSATLPE